MESFATEEEAHADGRYELEKINPSLEVVTLARRGLGLRAKK